MPRLESWPDASVVGWLLCDGCPLFLVLRSTNLLRHLCHCLCHRSLCLLDCRHEHGLVVHGLLRHLQKSLLSGDQRSDGLREHRRHARQQLMIRLLQRVLQLLRCQIPLGTRCRLGLGLRDLLDLGRVRGRHIHDLLALLVLLLAFHLR